MDLIIRTSSVPWLLFHRKISVLHLCKDDVQAKSGNQEEEGFRSGGTFGIPSAQDWIA